jgi:hypothetical protein
MTTNAAIADDDPDRSTYPSSFLSRRSGAVPVAMMGKVTRRCFREKKSVREDEFVAQPAARPSTQAIASGSRVVERFGEVNDWFSAGC